MCKLKEDINYYVISGLVFRTEPPLCHGKLGRRTPRCALWQSNVWHFRILWSGESTRGESLTVIQGYSSFFTVLRNFSLVSAPCKITDSSQLLPCLMCKPPDTGKQTQALTLMLNPDCHSHAALLQTTHLTSPNLSLLFWRMAIIMLV